MKLTLREIFLLILIVAVALGWWLDRQRLLRAPALTATVVSQVGRWQVVLGRDGQEILLDTTTGDTFRYSDFE